MNDKIAITLELSVEALKKAKEVIDETGDSFGAGMCPYPDSREWSEFKSVFADVTKGCI